MAQRLIPPVPSGLDALRNRQPGLRARPSPAGVLRLEGEVWFRAAPADGPTIEDTYRVRIDVPRSFPDSVPIVTEIGERISRTDPDAHVNPDGSLCLGAPLRLVLIAKENPSVLAFFDRCIVPALYNATHREHYGGCVPLGELEHGMVGELDDYRSLFGVQTYAQVFEALDLVGIKRRLANKKPCPCGCGRRLGVCRTNVAIRYVRETIGRPQCRRFVIDLRDRITAEFHLSEQVRQAAKR